jgi:hypothetical protein
MPYDLYEEAEYQGSMVMICSILAHARAPNTCTNLPMLLGLHLHSDGDQNAESQRACWARRYVDVLGDQQTMWRAA